MYECGASVLVNYQGSGEYLPADVVNVLSDNQYEVRFTVSGQRETVKESVMMPGMGGVMVEPDSYDATPNDAAKKKKKKKKSNVGWQGGGFEGALNGDDTPETEEVPASSVVVEPTKPSVWAPKEGDKVELKDFPTKTYVTVKIISIDSELGTVDCKHEDGTEAKGVPISLIRERKRKSKGKSKSASAKLDSAAPTVELADSATRNDIDVLLREMDEKQLKATLQILKALKSVSV